METPKKILIVDDEPEIRDLVLRFLTREGFDVTTAPNGALAQQTLGLNTFDVVLSDINMPGSRVNGLTLLQHVKGNYPGVAVILMTGFAGVANTAEANELGADAFLAKPFMQADLLGAIRSCLKMDDKPATTAVAINQDDNYSKLNIAGFLSGRTIRYPIFIRLGPQKYIKIANLGEDLPVAQIEHYKSKGIQFLYLLREDFFNYVRASLSISKAACDSKAISREKKLSVMKHTGEVILENMSCHPIDRERFEEAKSLVETTVDFLTEDRDSLELISSLNSYSDYLYAHSVGVSFYAALIARDLGWTSTPTLIKVSLAGLLHDVGYKGLDPGLVAKPWGLLTPEERKLLESHPMLGGKMLASIPRIPAEILQVVMQHHERDCGLGYPCNLSRSKIHPLAKVLAVADEFCDLAIRRPGGPEISPTEALQRIQTLHGSVLDPDALAALARILPKTTKPSHAPLPQEAPKKPLESAA